MRGCGSGGRFTAGYARQLDGNGGVRVAAAWRLLMDQMDQMDLMDKMGAPRYTPRVCGAAVGFGSGADLPLGWLLLIGAPTATLITLIILIILITLISAARRV